MQLMVIRTGMASEMLSKTSTEWAPWYVIPADSKSVTQALVAQVLVEQWRREYNTVRPHSALGYQPPAPEAVRPSSWFLKRPSLLGPPPRLKMVAGLT